MLADRVITAVSPTTKTNGIRLCQRVTKVDSTEEYRDVTVVTIEEYTRRDDVVNHLTVQVSNIPNIVEAINKFKPDKRKRGKITRIKMIKEKSL
jgi:hypothetical protein